MAHKKAAGSVKNIRDSRSKRLGVKRFGGQSVLAGEVLVRQRGTKFRAGEGVSTGKDHTIFATKTGTVVFTEKAITRFDGRRYQRKFVNVQ